MYTVSTCVVLTYSTGGSWESVPLLCQTANSHISVCMSACCTYVRMYMYITCSYVPYLTCLRKYVNVESPLA